MLQQQKFNPPASLPARALTSLNALNHGAAADTLFLPEEDPTLFFANLDDAFAHYQPSTSQDADLVTDSVQARWYLSRRQRAHANYEFQLHTHYDDSSFWPDASLNRLNLFDRYKTQAERALRRALVNVQAIRKDALRQQHSAELLALNKQRFQLQLEKWEYTKAKAVPSLQEDVDELRKFFATVQSRKEFGGSVIIQNAHIDVENGPTVIDIIPSNDKVREIIRQRIPNPRSS